METKNPRPKDWKSTWRWRPQNPTPEIWKSTWRWRPQKSTPGHQNNAWRRRLPKHRSSIPLNNCRIWMLLRKDCFYNFKNNERTLQIPFAQDLLTQIQNSSLCYITAASLNHGYRLDWGKGEVSGRTSPSTCVRSPMVLGKPPGATSFQFPPECSYDGG
ncbi:hypothetical protein AMTR_s00064p00120400 [Amborella trichopoda]|uniref:Uncharacterized protein n=1 Tax=Amborella trichopoda TaxID=13333 RepID=U5DEC4_AMBTC|nr:hypothetical protein AMTR_s00064p00120400 [Amborella trichopoda]